MTDERITLKMQFDYAAFPLWGKAGTWELQDDLLWVARGLASGQVRST